jgi:hypothetical protein
MCVTPVFQKNSGACGTTPLVQDSNIREYVWEEADFIYLDLYPAGFWTMLVLCMLWGYVNALGKEHNAAAVEDGIPPSLDRALYER